jgi:glycosyltransferase involved in cell wall biosynthesis
VLFVGRLVPEKGVDVLLRAFHRLGDCHRLVIAGDSSFTDGYVEQLHNLARDDPRVIFVGYVYGATLAELYSNAAVFVNPSILEGLPLTVLEAASYGTPIVASDIPPHVEILERDGPGHRLVATGDERALAAALHDALTDPAVEVAGARHLKERILREYSWEKTVDELEALYRRLVRQGTGARRLALAGRPR